MSFVVDPAEIFNLLQDEQSIFVPAKMNVLSAVEVANYFNEIAKDGGELNCKWVGGSYWKECVFEPFDYYKKPNPLKGFDLSYDNGRNVFWPTGPNPNIRSDGQIFAYPLAAKLRSRIYSFSAERLKIGEKEIGIDALLFPDAGNLPQVLNLLQTKNPARFKKLIEKVRLVFPDIQDIAVPPVSGNIARINIWNVSPETEREDLSIPIFECGTGIGQVLAILYVVLTSNFSRTIIVDEPQSFLHPGAVRKLIDILREYPQHQYIFATHSPTVVSAAGPEKIVLVKKSNEKAIIEKINVQEIGDLRIFLLEIGARLSDVFGADNILWVEGQTEEICFKNILQSSSDIPLLGTEIIGVRQVGDLVGKDAARILEIYKKLCVGNGLMPPALAFVFDQEKRTVEQMEDLKRQSKGLIKFIPRRMYENYLLNPKAISEILLSTDPKGSAATPEAVSQWLEKRRGDEEFEKWVISCDAAKILNELFNHFSETRVCYDKLEHGVKITDWIIRNDISDFSELIGFLKTIFLADRT